MYLTGPKTPIIVDPDNHTPLFRIPAASLLSGIDNLEEHCKFGVEHLFSVCERKRIVQLIEYFHQKGFYQIFLGGGIIQEKWFGRNRKASDIDIMVVGDESKLTTLLSPFITANIHRKHTFSGGLSTVDMGSGVKFEVELRFLEGEKKYLGFTFDERFKLKPVLGFFENLFFQKPRMVDLSFVSERNFEKAFKNGVD